MGRAVSADGTLGAELALADGNLAQRMADVVYTGTDFLVVYLNADSPRGIYTLRTTTTDPGAPAELLDDVEIMEAPVLLATDDGYVILYRTLDGLDTRLYYVGLDSEGALAVEPTMLLSNGRVYDATYDGSHVVVAATITDFVDYQLFLLKLNSDGSEEGERFVMACGESITNPAIEWTGEDFVLAWTESVDDIYMPSRLFAQRISF